MLCFFFHRPHLSIKEMNINNWDIVKIFKDIRSKLITVNKAVKTDPHHNPYKFEKLYNLDRELEGDLYPFNRWFKEDMIRWMSSWGKPLHKGELFHAKIVISYINKDRTTFNITENYKYFSDSRLHSDARVLKWKQFLVLASIEARNIKLPPIKSIYIDLEWYNLSDDIKAIWEILSHGDTTNNIDQGINLLSKDDKPSNNKSE